MVSCNVSCWAQLVSVFWGMLNSLRWWFTDCSVRRIKKANVQSLYWSFGFIDISTWTPSTCYWVHIRVLWSSFPLHWKPNILSLHYDSWWQRQMSVRELKHDKPSRWFSKSRGLSASVSFLSSPPPPRSFTCAIFRAVFDSRSSFSAPKPHGNACYAGYDIVNCKCRAMWIKRWNRIPGGDEGGGLQIGEITCGGSPHVIKRSDYTDRPVNPPGYLTYLGSPTFM